MELDEVAGQPGRAWGSTRCDRRGPIRAKASTPAEINELFDAIAYEKGAAVLRMVESWVGAEAFRTGVNAYVERFKYGNARAEDFWDTLAKSTGKPVDRVMSDVRRPARRAAGGSCGQLQGVRRDRNAHTGTLRTTTRRSRQPQPRCGKSLCVYGLPPASPPASCSRRSRRPCHSTRARIG